MSELKLVRNLQPYEPDEAPSKPDWIWAGAFAKTGKSFSVVTNTGRVATWFVRSAKEGSVKMLAKPQMWMPKGHDQVATYCCYHPNGKLLATVSDDNTVKFWDIDDDKLQRLFDDMVTDEDTPPQKLVLRDTVRYPHMCYWACFSPEGSYLAVATAGGEVHVLRTSNLQQPLRKIQAHKKEVRCCMWHPTLPLLVTSSDESKLSFFHPLDGTEVDTFSTPQPIWAVEFDPTGSFVAGCCSSGEIFVVNIANRKLLPSWKAHGSSANGCAWRKGNNILVTCADGGDVTVWDVARYLTGDVSTPTKVHSVTPHAGPVYHLGVHPSSDVNFTSVSQDGFIKLWKDPSLKPSAEQASATSQESTKKQVPPPKGKFHVFLSHNWGTDALGRSNHIRVGMIMSMLEKYGVKCWFDEDRLEGDIQEKMCNGIDDSDKILVFITEQYVEKVRSPNDDNCKMEFGYAQIQKTGQNMLPVLMESQMKDKAKWKGKVGFVLSQALFYDMSHDDQAKLEKKVESLVDAIIS